jgi:hypothetical protein
MDPVRNISETGVYLITEERPPRDTFISLILQREGPLEKDPERRIMTQARVSRCGDDGVGLSFIVPDDKASRQWEHLLERMVDQIKTEDLPSFVRLNGAIRFLSRICPDAADEVSPSLIRLSSTKVENAVEIALHAESLLSSDSSAVTMRADARLVGRIVEDGSGAHEKWLQHHWGGLLASSCTQDGTDHSNLPLIELLSKLVALQGKILGFLCTRATKVRSESGAISAQPVVCRMDEIAVACGCREGQVERELDRLSELGLIEKRSSHSSVLSPSDNVSAAPSGLGLKLHARCSGYRGTPEGFYEMVAAELPSHV